MVTISPPEIERSVLGQRRCSRRHSVAPTSPSPRREDQLCRPRPCQTNCPSKAARTVPRPAAGLWPGLQDPGENRLRMRVARGLMRAAVRRMPMRLVVARRHRRGRWRTELPGRPPHPARGLLHRGSAARPDRLRRGMDGRRLGLRRPRRRAAAASARTSRSSSRARCAGCGASTTGGSRARRTRSDAVVSQENVHRHYDLSNDLFQTFLDESMMYSAAWFAGPIGADGQHARVPHHRPEPQDRRHPRHGRRPGRVARHRDRHRLGRGRHPRGAAGRPGHHADPLGPAGRARPHPRARRRGCPTASPSTSATTATPPASTTRRSPSR